MSLPGCPSQTPVVALSINESDGTVTASVYTVQLCHMERHSMTATNQRKLTELKSPNCLFQLRWRITYHALNRKADRRIQKI